MIYKKNLSMSLAEIKSLSICKPYDRPSIDSMCLTTDLENVEIADCSQFKGKGSTTNENPFICFDLNGVILEGNKAFYNGKLFKLKLLPAKDGCHAKLYLIIYYGRFRKLYNYPLTPLEYFDEVVAAVLAELEHIGIILPSSGIDDFIVSRLDISLDIETFYLIRKYEKLLLYTSSNRFQFDPKVQGHCWRFGSTNSKRYCVVYDKAAQLKEVHKDYPNTLPPNLLRVETRIFRGKSGTFKYLPGVVTFGDLRNNLWMLEQAFYESTNSALFTKNLKEIPEISTSIKEITGYFKGNGGNWVSNMERTLGDVYLLKEFGFDINTLKEELAGQGCGKSSLINLEKRLETAMDLIEFTDGTTWRDLYLELSGKVVKRSSLSFSQERLIPSCEIEFDTVLTE